MILLKIVLPIIYSLFLGGAYGAAFRRKFGYSLMPAYCIQILLLLGSGMLFHNLLVGIVLACLLAIIGWGIGFRRDGRRTLLILRPSVDNLAVPAFLSLTLIVFAMNYGKQYFESDEFTHWGRFLKECCRLNQLYVTSPAQMAHKDYVPAVTLFEYLWCRLSLAYSEANAYRGIQMLLVAVVLSVAEKIRTCGKAIAGTLQYAFSVLVLMGIPLLFPAFRFYHTIYEDAIFGILIFYALWVALQDQESMRCRSVSLSIALSVLIMSKMTAAPFVLLIWLFYLWNEQKLGRRFRNHWTWQLLPMLGSAGIWLGYNQFVKRYVDMSGTQSYGGFTKELLTGVILHNGYVPWQKDVEYSYWKAIVSQGLVGGASFAFVAGAVMVVLIHVRNSGMKKEHAWCGNEETYRQMLVWMVFATTAYVLMMCILYDTSFSEYEARQLASYERYMSSWLIMMVYLLAVVLLTEGSGQRTTFAMTLITLLSFVVVADNRWQLLSGVEHTELEIERYEGETNLINSLVAEEESVLIIERGSNGIMTAKLGYYCLPRKIDFSSPGPAVYDGDIWSTDMTPDELQTLIRSHDYVYFIHVDQAFVQEYHEILPEIGTDTEGALYRVRRDGSRIVLIKEN